MPRTRKVPHEEIEISYEILKKLSDKKISSRQAFEELRERLAEYSAPDTTIKNYIDSFSRMMRGEVYKRVFSNQHLNYYLGEELKKDKDQVKVCLDGIEAHIDYLQNDSGMSDAEKPKAKATRRVHNEFSEKIKIELTYETEHPYKKINSNPESLEAGSKPSQNITEEQIKRSYELGLEVYKGEKGSTDARDELVSIGMNEETAGTLIYGFRRMMEGKGFSDGINPDCMEYYLQNIHDDSNYGSEKVEVCLNAIVEYLEKRPISRSIKKFNVHNKFRKIIEMESIASFIEKNKVEIERRIKSGKKGVRSPLYSGKYIVRLCGKNPRQSNTWGYRGNALLSYLEPISYEYYKKLGVRSNDISYDKKKGFTKHFNNKEEAENYCNDRKIKRFESDKEEDDMEVIENSQPIESKNDVEPYSIDKIIEDGCFIKKGELDKFLERLRDKKNLILQGSPGTGKTWLAKKLGYALIGKKDKEQVRSVQFHPSTSYEDFIMGYRPSSKGLTLEPGTFLKFIDKAKENPDEKFVMVIEEINRGNPVQIFGEMLTLLEADKRNKDEALWLCYQQEEESENPNAIDCYVYENNEPVYIPENLYVVGTMNLTDKSLGTLDFAFRRRFAFIDLEPQYNETWLKYVKEHFPKNKEKVAGNIKKIMDDWNEKIREDKSLGKQYCIGHSYFTPKRKDGEIEIINEPEAWFNNIFETEIIPLIEEYWLDDFENINGGKWEPMKKVQ